jgi:hypothetical protein
MQQRARRSAQPLVIVNTINVIAPYKYHDTWVFDDPRVGLVQEHFISGADTVIDRAVADFLSADRGFFLVFSGQPFPGYVVGLIWCRSDMDGNWYYSESLGHEALLHPALLKYFNDVPKALYFQCKAKPQHAKHPSEWAAREQPLTSGGHGDHQEPALPGRPHGAAAQRECGQAEQCVPDPYVPHLHRFAARAWLQRFAVLILFLIVTVNLILISIGLLGGSRPHGYRPLFLVWLMGMIGLVMLARLWRAMVRQRRSPPTEPTT